MTAPRRRAVYGFRLDPRRLYSGKISSSATRARRRTGVASTGFFFIFVPFTAGGRSRTDNTHFVRRALGEHNGEEPAGLRVPEQDEPPLLHGMPIIRDNTCQRVQEHGGSLSEGDPVFRAIGSRLHRIPLEVEPHCAKVAMGAGAPVTISLR